MNIEYQKKVKLGRDKMAQARNSVLTTRRAYAPSLVTLPSVESEEVDIAATDGKRIFYNPIAFADMGLRDCSLVIMHEIGHKWGMHPQRMAKLKATDPEIENIAMDLAFNCVLGDQESYYPRFMIFPTVGKYSHLPWGLSYEAYSKLLRDEKQQQQQRGDGDEGKDDNTMGDTGNEGGASEGGQDGDEGSTDENGTDESSEGEVRKFRGGDVIPSDGAEIQDVIKELNSGMSLSKCNNYYSKDKSGATVRKMLNDLITPPKIDYRRALRMYLAEKMSKRKRSYGRQSRFSGEFILPGYVRDSTICKTALVIDTSGSMNGLEQEVAAEVFGIVETFKQTLMLYTADTEVHQRIEVRNIGDLGVIKREGFKGGGGTDMGPAFRMAVRDGCKLIVNITDLCFSAPPNPRIPVIWADISEWGNECQVKQFGYGQYLKVEMGG